GFPNRSCPNQRRKRQPGSNEFSLHSANHKARVYRRHRSNEWRFMLRFKILVSVVPLIVAAILARIEFFPGPRPCIAVGADTVEIATAPWHADLHVSFTDDPRLATVRVAISDNAEAADFAVVDDADAAADGVCEATPVTQFIAISTQPAATAPVIFLSHEDG